MQHVLLILHLLGLAMGLSVPFANIVLDAVAKANPGDAATLMKFPPKMARVGDAGLALLLITGLIMLFTKYDGFAGMPWTFQVKMAAVVVLVVAVGMIHAKMKRAFSGDAAALARIQTLGKISLLSALTALVFAVLAFAK